VITVEQIKELRDRTGISIAQCKQALEVAGGDLNKAMADLKDQGAKVAEKKAGRQLGAGVVSAYIHNGNTLGVMVELDCETDFVAKNREFKTLADDLAMHVAAFEPLDLSTLLEQPFIKAPEKTVAEVLKEGIQKFGEKIEIVRFARLSVGEVTVAVN
jgi:elongation factor Ts